MKAWKRFGFALAIATAALIVSFLTTTAIMIACYARQYPHDGQSGIAAFMWGLLIAPVVAVVVFGVALRRIG